MPESHKWHMEKKTLIKIIKCLNKLYPVKIRRERPFEILIHGMLSHRTKDETTFPAQARLLKVANTPGKMMKLSRKEIQKLIYPVGFYKQKSKNILKSCKILIEKFNGKVPQTKEELMQLPGVGPKTASLVLVWGFNIPTIPVDVHVNRISQRLGIVPQENKPEKTQQVLENLIPDNLKEQKIIVNRVFVEFGKDVCRPVSPQCYRCPIYDFCKYEKKEFYKSQSKNSSHIFSL